jgi:small ligand-binding sensory domain FIST
MQSQYAVTDHWEGGFDESALQAWARRLRGQLAAPRVSLGLVFVHPQFFPHAAQVLELLRVYAQIPLLAGCSGNGLIVGDREIEEGGGLVLGLYAFPEAQLQACHFGQEQIEAADEPAFWHRWTNVAPEQINGWLTFVDPYHLNAEAWLQAWNAAYAGKPILGGLASGPPEESRAQVYLNGEVYEEGGVAIAFGGGVKLTGVISQGCTPIGETWTITKAEHALIHEIGNRPAYEVLVDTFNQMSAEDRKKSRGNLLLGLVINEYLDDFQRGDFLIRNLVAADPRSGSIAVGAWPRQGQTIQFQRRDARAAIDDLAAVLAQAQVRLASQVVYGGCLCSCNGRGHRLFGHPHHDAQQIESQLGPLPLTGFFCNGEIGPVGDRNFLHGYTAALALFVKNEAAI